MWCGHASRKKRLGSEMRRNLQQTNASEHQPRARGVKETERGLTHEVVSVEEKLLQVAELADLRRNRA